MKTNRPVIRWRVCRSRIRPDLWVAYGKYGYLPVAGTTRYFQTWDAAMSYANDKLFKSRRMFAR